MYPIGKFMDSFSIVKVIMRKQDSISRKNNFEKVMVNQGNTGYKLDF